MAFTSITVTHTFDGAGAAGGTVTFILSQAMTNGTETHASGETIEATLSGGGALSQALPATDDSATTPTGTLWLVIIRLGSTEQARTETYFVNVPSAAPGGTVDLFTLIPTTQQVN